MEGARQVIFSAGLAQCSKVAVSPIGIDRLLRQARGQHDLYLRPTLLRRDRELVAAGAAGHNDIREQQIDGFALQDFEGGLRAICLEDPIAELIEQPNDYTAQGGVIVDREHGLASAAAAPASARGR